MSDERSQLDKDLIAAGRAVCQSHSVGCDEKTRGDIWFVMSVLRDWEVHGARTAVAAMRAAWEKSGQRRVEEHAAEMEEMRLLKLGIAAHVERRECEAVRV